MRAKRFSAVVAVIALTCAGATALASSNASADPTGPQITTDLTDYAPGSTVTITGSGWSAAEHVHVTVDDSDGQSWHFADDTTADGSGGFVETVVLPNWFVANYAAVATGDAGDVARVAFTDSNVQANAFLGATQVATTMNVLKYFGSSSCGGRFKSQQVAVGATGQTNLVGVGGGTNNPQSAGVTTPSQLTSGGFIWNFDHWDVAVGSGNKIVNSTSTANPMCAAGGDSTALVAHYTQGAATTKTSQTISFTAIADATFGDPDFVISPSASSGLTVSLSATGNCTVGATSPATVHLTGAGSCQIVASQAGNGSYLAADNVEQDFLIAGAATTVTVNCPTSAQPYTSFAITPCSATATGTGLNQALTVTYQNNIDAGTATASASYAGDANHPAASNSNTFTISPAASAITVTCPASVPYTGSAQTPCTAGVTGVGGLNQPVTVAYAANTAVGTATASASYAGDTDHAAASNSTTFAIGKASSSTTLTCPDTAIFTGSAVTPCTASVTGAGGLNQAVTPSYTNNTAVGTAHAAASYAGDASHTSSSAGRDFSIVKASSLVAVTCTLPVTYNGSALTPCTATVTGAGGLNQAVDVTYSNNVAAGIASASASFAGDASHEASSDSTTFTIGKAPSHVSLTCAASAQYDGTPQTPCTASVTGAGGLDQPVSVVYGADNTNAGTVSASATFSGDGNHTGDSDSTTFEITTAPSTTTISCTDPVTFDGSAQTPCSAEVTGVHGLDTTVPVAYAADNTNAGSVAVSASYAGDGNYAASSATSSFTIAKASSTTLVTCPTSVTYTGSALTPCSASISGAGGLSDALTVHYVSNTHAGTATATAGYAGDSNHEASDDLRYFIINPAASTTTVTCNGPVSYDGSAQTPCTADVTGAGGLNQSLSVDYADNTTAGTATASASYLGDPDHTGSSDSTTFTIDKATSTVTVTCPTAAQTYTGFEQTPCTAAADSSDGQHVDGLTVGYDQNVNVGTASASADYAGDDNHAPAHGSATFDIAKASSTVDFTCPGNVTYTGTALTPCTAVAHGAGGLAQALAPTYTNNTNAGTAHTSATYAGDANHTASDNTAVFTIDKAPSTTTVSCPGSVTYDATAQTPCSATLTGAGGLTGSPDVSYTGNTDVGTAHATAGFGGDDNHLASNGAATFEIGKAASAVTVTCPGSQVYTGSALTPCSAAATGVGAVNVPLAPSYTDNVVVGTATASATWGGDGNHDGSSNSATFGITKAPSTVTVVCTGTVVYDGTAQTPCTATATGAGGLNQPLAVTYTSNVNAGGVTASASYAGDDNHSGNTGSAGFTIGKAPSSTQVTCPASVVYNGSAQAPCTAQVTGAGALAAAVSVDYPTDHTSAGTVNVSATYAGDGNHDGSTGAGSFVIARAPSTTTLSCPANVTYTGAARTPCTATVTGAGGLNQAVTPTYNNNTDAGTASSQANFAGDNNHSGSSDSTTFTIDKAASTVVFTCPASLTYNGAARTPCSAAATGAGGLNQPLTPTYSNNKNVGTAGVAASYAGDANHNGNTGSTTFAIGKAALTVTAQNASMTFGDPVPAIGYQLTGYVGGETLATSGVSGTPACSTTATSTSPAGNAYSTTCTVGSLAASNYSFGYVGGTMTVSTKGATLGYTGNQFFSTGSTSATTASVTLQGQLTPGSGGNPDLTKGAPIVFNLYKSTNLAMTTPDLTCPAATVSTTGVASCTISALGLDNWTVIMHMGAPGTNYFNAPDSDPVVVTVYQPATDAFATGGGWVADPGTNSHSNYGFTVRYKSGTNPSGQSVFVFRDSTYEYVVKSNSWQGGGLTFGTPSATTSTVSFSAKANVTAINRVTGQVIVGLGGGNYSFRVDAVDNGSPSTADTYAISVYTPAGTLYHQAGTTAKQLPLGGGNIVVHAK